MDLDNKLLHLGAEKRIVEEEMNNAKIKAQQQIADINHELNRTEMEKTNWFRRAEDLDKCLQAREQEVKDIKFDLDYSRTTGGKKRGRSFFTHHANGSRTRTRKREHQ